MIYKHFQDIKLSALSLGCMRLPTLDGDDSKIDQEATQKMVDYAMENGVNYYDTAWGYHGGNSEIAVGKALKKHPRDKFYLASKFPGYDLNNMDKVGAAAIRNSFLPVRFLSGRRLFYFFEKT